MTLRTEAETERRHPAGRRRRGAATDLLNGSLSSQLAITRNLVTETGAAAGKSLELGAEVREVNDALRVFNALFEVEGGVPALGAAARECGRHFVCMDVDPKWADEARDRHGLRVVSGS